MKNSFKTLTKLLWYSIRPYGWDGRLSVVFGVCRNRYCPNCEYEIDPEFNSSNIKNNICGECKHSLNEFNR